MISTSYALGIDIGGSGVRARLVPLAAPTAAVTLDAGSTGDVSADALAAAKDAVAALPADGILRAIAVGARGAASLLARPEDLARGLSSLGTDVEAVVAADTVTAHLGALAGAGGAVIALGTGAIALGTDHVDVWRRTGGWGYLYDDLGSGFWIGAAGLSIAVRHHDGVRADGRALLDAAVARFGEPERWPAALYPHDDRARRVAAFAADIAALDDPAAHGILRTAGRHAAETLAASAARGVPPLATATGGVAANPLLVAALRERLAELRPDIRWTAPLGTPLDGATTLALRAAQGRTAAVAGLVWTAER